MSELVRQHICLREVARRAESRTQLIVESEVDVDLLIERAIEGSHCLTADAATGLRRIAEQHELGVMPGRSRLLRKELRPRCLRRVEHEGDELHFLRFFRRLLDRRDFAIRALWRRTTRIPRAAHEVLAK